MIKAASIMQAFNQSLCAVFQESSHLWLKGGGGTLVFKSQVTEYVELCNKYHILCNNTEFGVHKGGYT